MIRLEPNVRKLIEMIGEDKALALVEASPGAKVYVATDGSGALADTIGQDAALKLAAEYGGLTYNVPVGRSWRIQLYRERQKLSYAAIAKRLGCCGSTVWRVLDKVGMTDGGGRRRVRQAAPGMSHNNKRKLGGKWAR